MLHGHLTPRPGVRIRRIELAPSHTGEHLQHRVLQPGDVELPAGHIALHEDLQLRQQWKHQRHREHRPDYAARGHAGKQCHAVTTILPPQPHQQHRGGHTRQDDMDAERIGVEKKELQKAHHQPPSPGTASNGFHDAEDQDRHQQQKERITSRFRAIPHEPRMQAQEDHGDGRLPMKPESQSERRQSNHGRKACDKGGKTQTGLAKVRILWTGLERPCGMAQARGQAVKHMIVGLPVVVKRVHPRRGHQPKFVILVSLHFANHHVPHRQHLIVPQAHAQPFGIEERAGDDRRHDDDPHNAVLTAKDRLNRCFIVCCESLPPDEPPCDEQHTERCVDLESLGEIHRSAVRRHQVEARVKVMLQPVDRLGGWLHGQPHTQQCKGENRDAHRDRARAAECGLEGIQSTHPAMQECPSPHCPPDR